MPRLSVRELAIREPNTSVRRGLSYIPQAGVTDRGELLTVAEALKQTKVHPSTLRLALRQGKIRGCKIDNRWRVRLRAISWWLEFYRYSCLGHDCRQGKRWSQEEIGVLHTDITAGEVARKLGRSRRAVLIMRCRKGIKRRGR